MKKEKEYQDLEEEIVKLRKELEKSKDELKMRSKYDYSTEALDKMLSKQKQSKDISGLGFEQGQSSNNKDTSGKEIQFTSSSEGEEKKTFTELIVKLEQKIAVDKKKETQLVWVEKEKDKEESSLIVQTSLHVERRNLWVVDNGCSNHMIGDRKKFIKLEDWNGDSVRFGDNSSIKIKGKGTLNIDGKLKAHDVYYVEGLKHNLLIVSQMCDKGYKFTFNYTGCQIKESIGQVVVEGKRTHGNVYNLNEYFESQCMLGQVNESQLWHI
ncbi:hypothetical protein SUGI_0613390 [Cryptomeria japonica]|nr:hypothetical protein SUGI_0613390 [Cryptomeria japonica]